MPAIPKSTKTERLRANSAVFDFSLTAEEMQTLNGLHDNRRLVQLDKDLMQEKFKIPCGYKLHLKTESGVVLPPTTTVKLPTRKSHERHHSCKDELVEESDLKNLEMSGDAEETSAIK